MSVTSRVVLRPGPPQLERASLICSLRLRNGRNSTLSLLPSACHAKLDATYADHSGYNHVVFTTVESVSTGCCLQVSFTYTYLHITLCAVTTLACIADTDFGAGKAVVLVLSFSLLTRTHAVLESLFF